MNQCALEADDVQEWRIQDRRHDRTIEEYYVQAPEHEPRRPAEIIYFDFNTAPTLESLKREFSKLAGRWESETAHTSSTHDMVMHQCYLSILTLGKHVVPLILERMKRQPNYWFLALRTLTGNNPVPTEASGDLQAMTDRWLDWGRQKGLTK